MTALIPGAGPPPTRIASVFTAGAHPAVTWLGGRALEVGRVAPVSGGAVHASAVEEGLLPRRHARRIAAPRAERRVLERTPVGEAERPRGGDPWRVHRVQVRRGPLLALAARQENHARHRGRD